jgi:ketosteroid isomerase-like protein
MKYLYSLIILFIFSCQSNPDPVQSKVEIARIIFDQQNAWNRGDIEGYMQGYLQSDSLRFASGGNVSYGWETTLDRYQKGYPNKETMGELRFSNIDIEFVSKDAALVFGKWELERVNDHPWGLFTLLIRRTDDGWRIVHDHTSLAKEN